MAVLSWVEKGRGGGGESGERRTGRCLVARAVAVDDAKWGEGVWQDTDIQGSGRGDYGLRK